jgi:hypothetical protein
MPVEARPDEVPGAAPVAAQAPLQWSAEQPAAAPSMPAPPAAPAIPAAPASRVHEAVERIAEEPKEIPAPARQVAPQPPAETLAAPAWVPPVIEPTPAPRAEQPRAEQPRVDQLAPVVSLTLPPDSDLVLVETRHAAPAPDVEEAPVERPRRARPPRVSIPEEPLQIVETRKE